MLFRRPIGNRNWKAEFKQHNGNVDDYGQPTYDVEADWTSLIDDWPCELITTVGGEVIRGKMVTEKSTHVLYGDLTAVQSVDAQCSVYIDGDRYGIEAGPIDPDGRNMVARIEVRRIP